MSGNVLGHAEASNAIGAKDLGHLLVGQEELLVLGILKTEKNNESAFFSKHILVSYISVNFLNR
jgi:hypothetical protein